MMRFTLNGKPATYRGDPELSLLSYLRDEAGVTTPKRGCADEGACGCCTVEVNDHAVLSCTLKMGQLEGAHVTTPDGLEQEIQEAFADAFVEKGGIQCGFCIPGIVMQARDLLKKKPNPSREEVFRALQRNLCRCTGYHKIVDSILLAAEAVRTQKKIELSERTGKIGRSYRKYDSRSAVLGLRPFVDDMNVPGTLFAALKLSDHPRVKVVSIGTSAASKVLGVVRVFTSKDIPGKRQIGLIVPDWPLMVAEGEETRYVGDVLAGVVAKTEKIAREAAAKIRVEYEVFPPLTDVFEAMKPDAPKLHPGGNILEESRVERGDAKKALAESAYVARGRFTTQRVEHAFLEPESCLAQPWEKGVKVFSQGQGAYEDRRQIAQILSLPEEKVNVIQVQTGGGFGGKEDMLIQGHAALFAYLLKKPVKLTLSRTESILMHPKRHPFVMDYVVGCDKNGKLTAIQAKLYADTGAYASVGGKVLERAVGHAAGAYSIPNASIRGWAVYTNNLPSGAMRGFGVPQSTFAIEGCIDDLCAQGKFDRWQFRYDNAITEGGMTTTGQIIRGGTGVRPSLLALQEEFKKARYAGIACGIKNTGIGNAMADIGRCKIEIVSPKKVVVHHGWTEMGQGIHTMAVQMLCEETGIDPAYVEVKVDTTAGAVCGMTTASRGTSLLGHSILSACKKLKADLKKKSWGDLEGRVYEGEWICDWTTKPGHPNAKGEEITHYSYGYATQVVVLNDAGKIDTVYAAHDAGKIINPHLYEGQIEGSIHMGLGYALTENLPMKDGRPVSTKFARLGVLRAKQMPKVVVKGVEIPDPNGPYGVKGVGEIGLVPTAAAVAGALRSFDGKQRFSLPMSDADVLPKSGY